MLLRRSFLLFNKSTIRNNYYTSSGITTYLKRYSTEKIDDDTPVKYSTSEARKWQAKVSRSGIRHPRLWYEPYVIIVSLTVFLVYFTILREENDIDMELNKSLYSRIEGLEEYQLQVTLKHHEAEGLETDSIRKRLKEVEEMKTQSQ